MGITDLFRPNWKHSDAAVRARAVRAMDADDLSLLLKIAQSDEDRAVRELAVARIDDADALDALADSCSRRSTASAARERACTLRICAAVQGDDPDAARQAVAKIHEDTHLADIVRRAHIEEIRLLALDRLQDERALAEVIRASKDRQLCRTLLDRIEELAILRSLALEEQRRELAQAALERVDDPDALRTIAKGAKVKAVRKRAKKRLDTLTAPDPEVLAQDLAQKRLHAQLVQLCRRAEELAASTDWERASSGLDALQSEWDELTFKRTHSDEKIQQRFKAALLGFSKRRDQALAMLAGREDRAARRRDLRSEHQAELDARAAICERILALDGEDASDRLGELQRQWEQRGELPAPLAEEAQKRYDTAVRQCQRRLDRHQARADAGERVQELLAELERALEIRKMTVLRKRFEPLLARWNKVAGDATEEQRGHFDSLAASYAERDEQDRARFQQRKEENRARIEELIELLRAATSSEDIREVDRLLKQARATLKKPGPLPSRDLWRELRPTLDEAQQGLYLHLQDLREADSWQRWANTPRAEELCKEAEALAELEDLAEVARRLRPLQKEWKKIGPVSRDQANERWQRFKAACDSAYERCAPFFAEQETQRQENLLEKEQLCALAEELADSTQWSETTDRLKQLQTEWKAIGPVPRKSSDAVWRRFRAACDRFFDRRKEHFKAQDAERKVNLEKKTTLCERAEELARSSEWVETAEKLKALQAEWKSLGPVPRSKSDAIWERFRAACDLFFARRKSHLDEGRGENLAQKRALCDALEAALDHRGDASTAESLAALTLKTWERFEAIGPIPFDEERPMQERLNDLTLRAVEAHPGAFGGTPLDPEANARRQAELCMQAEVLATSARERRGGGRIDLEDQDPEMVAARLKEAMASNAFKEESRAEDAQRMADQVAALRRSWARVGPVAGEKRIALQERFERACAEILGPGDR